MMKKILFGIFCLFVVLCIISFNPPEEKKWSLVWEDNFDRDGVIDSTKWSRIPRGGADWNKYLSDFDSCYAVKDGNLILTGMVNNSLSLDTAKYLTGGIYTKARMNFTSGKIE